MCVAVIARGCIWTCVCMCVFVLELYCAVLYGVELHCISVASRVVVVVVDLVCVMCCVVLCV